jgi:hypothetical protein
MSGADIALVISLVLIDVVVVGSLLVIGLTLRRRR